MRIIEEIGRLLKSALPYAIVSANDQGFFANMLCYKEIQNALDAGHTSIYVKNGTYAPISMVKPGTIVKGSRKAIISRRSLAVSAVNCNNVDYCTFEGLSFKGSTGLSNFININSNYNLFNGCKAFDSIQGSFELQQSNNMIVNCLCENTSTWGIVISAAASWNNIAGITTLNNSAGPVYMSSTTTRNVVSCVQSHNTVSTNYVTQFDSAVTQNVIVNSISDTGNFLGSNGTNVFNNHILY